MEKYGSSKFLIQKFPASETWFECYELHFTANILPPSFISHIYFQKDSMPIGLFQSGNFWIRNWVATLHFSVHPIPRHLLRSGSVELPCSPVVLSHDLEQNARKAFSSELSSTRSQRLPKKNPPKSSLGNMLKSSSCILYSNTSESVEENSEEKPFLAICSRSASDLT